MRWLLFTVPIALVASVGCQDNETPPPGKPPYVGTEPAALPCVPNLDGKIDSSSDEFQLKFDDVLPQAATRNAAKCYTGGINRVHRNQKVKLRFRNHIKDGVVSISDVQLVEDETTIHDKAMVDCFMAEVAKTTWTDPTLPDWDQPDELIIRPERGMKKFMKSNIEYEGAEGPADFGETGSKQPPSAAKPSDDW